MSVINIADHRQVPTTPLAGTGVDHDQIVADYTVEGQELAELAHPFVEPFRECEPDLEQHLKAAFLRWQMKQIKKVYRNEPGGAIAIGLALAVTVEAFTDRMIELQGGRDSPDGGLAA